MLILIVSTHPHHEYLSPSVVGDALSVVFWLPPHLFTMILFDVEICIQDDWVQLWNYRPVSRFPSKRRNFKLGGIGPTQSQDSEEREMVNWFTTILFDVLIYIQDHWVKLWIYGPVSRLLYNSRYLKFVNLTISGGIGPIQSQDKTAKKGRWWTGSIRLQEHWLKFWTYGPVSLLPNKLSSFKFVNLTISSGIGPIQSQDITERKGW